MEQYSVDVQKKLKKTNRKLMFVVRDHVPTYTLLTFDDSKESYWMYDVTDTMMKLTK